MRAAATGRIGEYLGPGNTETHTETCNEVFSGIQQHPVLPLRASWMWGRKHCISSTKSHKPKVMLFLL